MLNNIPNSIIITYCISEHYTIIIFISYTVGYRKK